MKSPFKIKFKEGPLPALDPPGPKKPGVYTNFTNSSWGEPYALGEDHKPFYFSKDFHDPPPHYIKFTADSYIKPGEWYLISDPGGEPPVVPFHDSVRIGNNPEPPPNPYLIEWDALEVKVMRKLGGCLLGEVWDSKVLITKAGLANAGEHPEEVFLYAIRNLRRGLDRRMESRVYQRSLPFGG